MQIYSVLEVLNRNFHGNWKKSFKLSGVGRSCWKREIKIRGK